MKDRWCGNFDSGKCMAADANKTPALADVVTEELGIQRRTEVVTDPSRIGSILSLKDSEVPNTGEVPSQITLVWHERQNREVYKCSGRYCKSRQRKCDSFK